MRVAVLVKANSRKGPLVEVVVDGALIVFIREVAADGKANAAVLKLLAKHYGVSKSNITIISGQTSRHKLLEINP